MSDPRIAALPFQILVLVEGAPVVVVDPTTFDEVLIDEVDHLIAATGVTVQQVLLDAIAERAKPTAQPARLRLNPLTSSCADVCRALIEDLPEMANDDMPLNGGDAVDVLASVWPALLAAFAREARAEACIAQMDNDTACPDDPDGVHHIGCGCDNS